jgi:hypothetical protein
LNEKQIQTLGYELLYEFGNELFEILDRRLAPKYGNEWFSKTLKFRKGGKRASSPRDVHTIIHQIVTEKNNEWRGAIAAEFKMPDYGKYAFKYFEKILESRNKWMHPDDVFSKSHLIDLVDPIHKIFGNQNHPLGDKCEEILERLKSGMNFTFAIFSSAFGEEYLLTQRQNQLLRDEILRFRDLTNSKTFKGSYLPEHLEDLKREELLELISQFNNEKVVLVEDLYFYKHFGERADIRASLIKVFTQFSVLIGMFDEDLFFNNGLVELVLRGEKVNMMPELLDYQKRDLLRAYFTELAELIKRIILFSSEAGPENCVCKVCEICGPVSSSWFGNYDDVAIAIGLQMFNWRGALEDVEGLSIEQMVGEEVIRMQILNNFTDDEMELIFEGYSGSTKEDQEEMQQIRGKVQLDLRKEGRL